MSEIHKSAHVPEFFCRKTVETMPVDTPYYIDPMDIEFWVNSRNNLCVAKDEELDEADTTIEQECVAGRVGLMVATTVTKDNRLRVGYVADMRFAELDQLSVDHSDEQAPDDQEEFNDWHDRQSNTIIISGIMYDDEDDKTCYSSDEDFKAATEYLARMTDNLEPTPQPAVQVVERKTRRQKIVDSAKLSIQVLRNRVKQTNNDKNR